MRSILHHRGKHRVPRPKRFTAMRLHTCRRHGRRHRLWTTYAVLSTPLVCPRPWTWVLYGISNTSTPEPGKAPGSEVGLLWEPTTFVKAGLGQAVLTPTKLGGAAAVGITPAGTEPLYTGPGAAGEVKPRGSGDPIPHHTYRSMAVGGIAWEASRATQTPQHAMNTTWVPGTTSWKAGAAWCDTCRPTSKRIKLGMWALS